MTDTACKLQYVMSRFWSCKYQLNRHQGSFPGWYHPTLLFIWEYYCRWGLLWDSWISIASFLHVNWIEQKTAEFVTLRVFLNQIFHTEGMLLVLQLQGLRWSAEGSLQMACCPPKHWHECWLCFCLEIGAIVWAAWCPWVSASLRLYLGCLFNLLWSNSLQNLIFKNVSSSVTKIFCSIIVTVCPAHAPSMPLALSEMHYWSLKRGRACVWQRMTKYEWLE